MNQVALFTPPDPPKPVGVWAHLGEWFMGEARLPGSWLTALTGPAHLVVEGRAWCGALGPFQPMPAGYHRCPKCREREES